MLKNLSLTAVLAGFCLSGLTANTTDSRFSLTGEYLSLKPTFDDTYFLTEFPKNSIQSSETPGFAVKRRNNNFDYNPGFRVAGSYKCSCEDSLLLAYTHLDASSSKKVTPFNSDISPTNGAPLFNGDFEYLVLPARSTVKSKYRRAEALYNKSVYEDCTLSINVGIGIDMAELDFEQKEHFVSYPGYTGNVRIESNTKGIGPELYFGLHYPLFKNNWLCQGNLALNFSGSASLLVSESRAKSYNDVTDDLTGEIDTLYMDAKNQRECRFIPAFHARVGLSYEFEICCNKSSFEVGYQFSSYLNGLMRLNYGQSFGRFEVQKLSYTTYDNYDLQGVYVSLSANF